jgi:deoxyribonuclease-1
MKTIISLLIAILIATPTFAANQEIQSFSKAKKILEKKVYNNHRTTLYCDAKFDAKKKVTPPKGFTTTKYLKRSKKIEWEHVVPAENFGRSFSEWRDGNKQCINSKSKAFKGRRCAEKTNLEYRYMQSDMFNLYPAIGAVNALRSNYNFTMLPSEKSDFGSCAMKIDNRKAEPPEATRGRIARTYLYMEGAYKRYKMSKSQRQLMMLGIKCTL